MALPSESIVGVDQGESKARGLPWPTAWNKAINHVAPPGAGGPDAAASADAAELRAVIGEAKPYLRAAYEGTPVQRAEAAVAAASADARLADLRLEREGAPPQGRPVSGRLPDAA